MYIILELVSAKNKNEYIDVDRISMVLINRTI